MIFLCFILKLKNCLHSALWSTEHAAYELESCINLRRHFRDDFDWYVFCIMHIGIDAMILAVISNNCAAFYVFLTLTSHAALESGQNTMVINRATEFNWLISWLLHLLICMFVNSDSLDGCAWICVVHLHVKATLIPPICLFTFRSVSNSNVKWGQNFEARARATRSRPKSWGQGQCLELEANI